VTNLNDAPVADDQQVTTPEDTPAAITLTGSDLDGDPLTYSLAGQPAHGSLAGVAPNLTYLPATTTSVRTVSPSRSMTASWTAPLPPSRSR